MSEFASEHYRQRADSLGIELPPVLGMPYHRLFEVDDTTSTTRVELQVSEQLGSLIASVESFALDSVRAALRARGVTLSDEAWKRIRHLPPPPGHGRQRVPFINRRVVPSLVRGLPRTGALYLEPVTRKEIGNGALNRAAFQGGWVRTREPEEEPAQVLLLGRTVTAYERNVQGWLTVMWADYKPEGRKETLMIRYAGASLSQNELYALPKLT